MIVKRCNFCHKDILVSMYDSHIQQHLQCRDDGQQTDYATLPEQERQGVDEAFEDAPKWYRHEKCGQTTGMPEEIIKTYLKDPWFYNNKTYCCGCETHVLESECFWVETGQNLHEYKNQLKRMIRRPPPTF